jgi:hypothetical protein
MTRKSTKPEDVKRKTISRKTMNKRRTVQKPLEIEDDVDEPETQAKRKTVSRKTILKQKMKPKTPSPEPEDDPVEKEPVVQPAKRKTHFEEVPSAPKRRTSNRLQDQSIHGTYFLLFLKKYFTFKKSLWTCNKE